AADRLCRLAGGARGDVRRHGEGDERALYGQPPTLEVAMRDEEGEQAVAPARKRDPDLLEAPRLLVIVAEPEREGAEQLLAARRAGRSGRRRAGQEEAPLRRRRQTQRRALPGSVTRRDHPRRAGAPALQLPVGTEGGVLGSQARGAVE